MAQYSSQVLTIFGGERGWSADDWTASDDSVRGGRSESHLECAEKLGRFYGTLDIKTLGGAGFASQRTTGDKREWDLANYAGIQLNISKGDSTCRTTQSSARTWNTQIDPGDLVFADTRTEKRYTFILKDEILSRDPDTDREQASISWECDFELPPQTKPGETHDCSVFIPWKALNPTYRGKVKKDAKPLDRQKIKRMSIMMRSFFGSQEGDFSLSIRSIKALTETPASVESTVAIDAIDYGKLEKAENPIDNNGQKQGYPLDANAGCNLSGNRRTCILILGAAAILLLYLSARQLSC